MDITLYQAVKLSDAITTIAFATNQSTESNLDTAEKALLAVFDILGVKSVNGKTIEEYKKEDGAE